MFPVMGELHEAITSSSWARIRGIRFSTYLNVSLEGKNFNLLITNSLLSDFDWVYAGSWIRIEFHDNKLEICNNTTRMMNEYYGVKMI